MLKPIRTKKDYRTAVERIYVLMQKDLKVDSNEYNELDLLSILVDNYKMKHFPIDFSDPIETIKFRLEQLNLGQAELVRIIGSKSRTSEILNKKRKLSLSMIRSLHNKLKIPVESLISDYSKRRV